MALDCAEKPFLPAESKIEALALLHYPLPAEGAPRENLVRKAPGTTTVHLPPAWRSVSNGKLLRRWVGDQEAVDVWQTEVPTARSLVAARYEVARQEAGGHQIDVYYFPPNRERAEKQARIIGQAVGALERRFGPYPYLPLVLAEAPENAPRAVSLGVSNSSFILARLGRLESLGWEVGVLSHEVAHGWWGSLVAGSGSGWTMLTEGMAQYARVVASETIEGGAAAEVRMTEAVQDYPWDRQLAIASDNDAVIKTKGVWILHMLRLELGDTLFFGTLRQLIRRHRDTSFVQVAPTKTRLERFFAQWLDRGEAPSLDVEWSDASEGGRNLTAIVLRQDIRNREPFAFEVQLAVDAREGTRIHTINVTSLETRVVVASAGVATGVRLDPTHRLFIRRKD